MNISLRDYPVVFLSYEEPNCEENWQRVLQLIPTALRVHGVKGSDRAHKACAAEAGDCERFWTIDGDNWLLYDAIHYRQEIPKDLNTGKEIYSHCSKNPVTGLVYGNGGLKLWPKSVVLDMKTHEAAEDNDQAAIDFCWALDYVLMSSVLSETRSAENPEQAWRSAFRESVKLSQIAGSPAKSIDHWIEDQADINKHRLAAWMMVGMDHRHGVWSILGARQAQVWLWRDQGNWAHIEDFDYLDQLWRTMAENLDLIECLTEVKKLGRWLNDQGMPLDADPLSKDHSSWYKKQQIRDLRTQPRKLK